MFTFRRHSSVLRSKIARTCEILKSNFENLINDTKRTKTADLVEEEKIQQENEEEKKNEIHVLNISEKKTNQRS